MSDYKSVQEKFISHFEQINFFSNVNEKQRPPVSPITSETRELSRRNLDELEKNIEKAKIKARETGSDVEVDGSKLSGIKSGDIWLIDKEGIKQRNFELNHGLLEGLLQRRSERIADPDRDVDMDLLLKILSYAQWAPNATNEQPTKIMIYKKNHTSMQKIGDLMNKALHEKIIPNINIRNYIINKKRENPNFLPDKSLKDLTEMSDAEFNKYKFADAPAPLKELPQTAEKLFERDKIIFEDGKYYKKAGPNKKGDEFTMKNLLDNDVVFTAGMGKFFLKFRNTHPYLIVIFRKWSYTSLMTETLFKYGIQLPDVGEEFIDSGFYTDHLSLATRGFGLSGIVKTGPMDLAKDELTELFISDLKEQIYFLVEILENQKSLTQKKKELIEKEIQKVTLLHNGLKFGLEAMRCKEKNLPLREPLLIALKRGEVYVPATFFQLGYPLPKPEERVLDPRQGKDPMDEMMVYLGDGNSVI